MSNKVMIMGNWISVDEQTISFKGRHADKFRINYRKEGDGFQCDAICADGYKFSIYFRNLYNHNNLLIKVYVNYIPG